MPDVEVLIKAKNKQWQRLFDGNLFNIMWNLYGAPIAQEAALEMKSIEQDTIKMLDTTVEGWEHKPDFEAEVTTSNINPEGIIQVGNVKGVGAIISLNFRAGGENGENWRRVDKGTTPHAINSAPGGPAMPIGAHVPSTIPGRISSRGPRQRGPLVRLTRHVKRQYIVPRGFSDEINAHWGPPGKNMSRRITNAIKRAGRRSGI